MKDARGWRLVRSVCEQTLAAGLGGPLGLVPSDHWQDRFFQLACGMPWTCLQTEQRDWDSVRAGKDMLNTEAMIEPTLHAWASWTVQTPRWAQRVQMLTVGQLEGSEGFCQASRRTPTLA